jgi:hypothetical protein
MPELETRIQEWKRSLAIAFGGSGEILEELESHLREEIDRLMQAGQAPDAALAAAQAKLGRPVDLAAEYARAVPPAHWLPIRVGLALLVLLLGSFTWMFVVPGFRPGGDVLLALHVAAVVAGYAAGFYAGLLGICYVGCWLIRPIGLGQRRSLGRTLFVANAGATLLLLFGMVLGGVWAHERWGRAWNNDPREIGALIPLLWFAALTAMLWTAPRKQHLWVLLSVLAIGVGVWGWFGPSLLSEQLHAYGIRTAILCLVIVCTAVPLVVALLGLLPPGRLRRQRSAATLNQ